jgi:protein gp37
MEIVSIGKNIKTLNPVNGCTAGCSYCYARKINNRFKVSPDFGVLEFSEHKLKRIIKGKKPVTYFMTSMSDFSQWHADWRTIVFDHLKNYPTNSYLFLSKFPENYTFETQLNSVWIGTTITSKNETRRIGAMLENIKAKNYFIAFEPLFGDLGEMDLEKIGWVVIGTETGNRKGKITSQKDWILNIAQQARAKQIPVFMKESLLTIVGEENMIQELPIAWQY